MYPQVSKKEFEKMAEMAEKVKFAAYMYMLLQIAGLFILQRVIFSMWSLILILQFFAYIAVWKINFPVNLSFAFYSLRIITLGEFLDDLELGK